MAIRSFLAFELSAGIRETVKEVLDQVKQYDLNVRWVPLTNIHLTVVFLGGIREEDVPAMGEEIEKSCSLTGPFDISLKDMGCFPNNRHPRVIWLGLKGDTERMNSFRNDLQSRLIPFGIQQEKRPFQPHLTLGRFKKTDKKNAAGLEKILERCQVLGGPGQTLAELVQFRSDLRPGGAIYTKMGEWKLKEDKG